MDNIHSILPVLTLNKLFVRDLMSAQNSCFALGYVEESGVKSGFLALRPGESIPSSSTQQGFRFGHSVLGLDNSPVLHFAFEFYGHKVYHSLVNPGNPIVQAVLSTMIETQDYFFFAINPDQTVTSFRSRLETPDLAGLKTNLEHFKKVTCMPGQYDKTLAAFRRKPDPAGSVLEWVCRDNMDYLDLTHYRLELTPQ